MSNKTFLLNLVVLNYTKSYHKNSLTQIVYNNIKIKLMYTIFILHNINN